MSLTDQDKEALRLLESGDMAGFVAHVKERADYDANEQAEYNARLNAVLAQKRVEALRPLGPMLYPGNYLDVNLPLIAQDPVPYLTAIVAALKTAFDEGAKAVGAVVGGELSRIRAEALKEMDGNG